MSSTKASSASGREDTVMESNACLREAIGELKAIVGARESRKGAAACILEEVQRLEDETAARAARIRQLVGKLD